MKFYQLVWLYAASYFFALAGAALLVISLFGPPTQTIALVSIGVYICIKVLVYIWIKAKVRAALNVGNQTQRTPVSPSGNWIEPDMHLAIGSRVLVPSDKAWYRGIIVGVKSRDRFLVRIEGLDPFFDQVHHRSKLQLEETDTAVQAHREAVQ